MNKLDLLKIAENQDTESFEAQDFEQGQKTTETQKYKQKYCDFYDDIKQNSKYIKEDWWNTKKWLRQ